MLGDDVRRGWKLLCAFMPISLEAVADVEHGRTSTSAGVAAPVADGGCLQSFSRTGRSYAPTGLVGGIISKRTEGVSEALRRLETARGPQSQLGRPEARSTGEPPVWHRERTKAAPSRTRKKRERAPGVLRP